MRANTVTARAVDWLWYPYLPLGKVSSLAGQMGQAKSLFTVWLAASVTRGDVLTLREPGSVIVLSAEDDPEDTIVPRLEAAGADLDRVWIEPESMLDVERLARACDELDNPRLVTVDPVQAYLPSGVNAWKGQDVRRALEPLRTFSAERELASLLLQHTNRRADAADALARISDSQGIPQVARSVLIWGPDPSDPDGDDGTMKALTRAKGNLARRSPESATFAIEERTVRGGIAAPVLVRGDDKRISADDVLADRETRSALDEAAEWLRNILASGPLAAREIYEAAEAEGIATRTLKRAKRAAGVHTEQQRNDDGSAVSGWIWSLTTRKEDGAVGPLGTVDPLDQGAKGAKGSKVSNASKPHSAVSDSKR